MADKTDTEEEPSIEEILDSIRQIISDDDDELSSDGAKEGNEEEDVAAKEPPPEKSAVKIKGMMGQDAVDAVNFDEVEEPAPAPENDEPLDQSAIDDMDFGVPTPTPDPEDAVYELTERIEDDAEDDADVDLVDEDKPETPTKAEPEKMPPEDPAPIEKSPPVTKENSDTILTNAAEEAAFSAIKDLARKTAVEHNGITLEEIVRNELKPMLSVWLDNNLPVLIERLVREELERVSKRVLDD